jgi:apolipoprotein N-acyltransferase
VTRLALVQASRSEKTSGAAVECISNFDDYAQWTRVALADRPDLILWPESTCDGDAAREAWTQNRLRDLTRGTGTHLLVGSFVANPDSGLNTNSAVMLAPEGGVLGQYAKVRIVPFGEYLPVRPLLNWTVALGMPPRDLEPGRTYAPVPWPRGSVGVSICFESAFGDISRRMVLGGANVLGVLTSDGWVGREAAGLQHAAFAPLRAVETRRSVARAAATGISELIDPYGRPIRSLGMFQQGVVTGELPLRTEITPYVRLGDWPVTLAALILAAAALAGIRRRL